MIEVVACILGVVLIIVGIVWAIVVRNRSVHAYEARRNVRSRRAATLPKALEDYDREFSKAMPWLTDPEPPDEAA